MTGRIDNIAPMTYPTTGYKSVRYKGTPPPAVADGDAVTVGGVRTEVVGLVLLLVVLVVLIVLATVLTENDGQGQCSCC
jgi:hypothetical protein